MLELTEPTHTFEFTGIAERPVLSINRGFSAPIKLVTDLDADDLAFLAAHDSDAFNRWQALQTIAHAAVDRQCGRVACRQAAAHRRQADRGAGRHSRRRPAGAGLCRAGAGAAGRRRYRARNRQRHRPRCNSSAPARRCAPISAEKLGTALAKVYDRMAITGPYSPDAASAGQRALRNVALDLLAATTAPRRSRARHSNMMPPTT